MKAAFLILAHTDPVQLRRLIHAMDYPDFDLYVHVDNRQNLDAFHLEDVQLQYSSLYILKERENVHWGDISIVKATLNMYRKAAQTCDYDWYVTLSGLDYPIASNEEIARQLQQSDREWIMGNPLETREYHRVECKYHMDKMWLVRLRLRAHRYLHIRQKDHVIRLPDGRVWTVYFAPQWHALSGPCVNYMLETLDAYPCIWEYFRYSYAPDELLIPTLIFNSKFRDRTMQSDFPPNTHYNHKTAITYLNYEPNIQVFGEESYRDIVGSHKMFVRKVRTEQSAKLLDLLDEYRSQQTFSEN